MTYLSDAAKRGGKEGAVARFVELRLGGGALPS